MAQDARFEDGAEQALHLGAVSSEDLQVISALTQDAVLTAADIRWEAKGRRLVLLLNRFRWEDRADAEREGRKPERVRALLILGDVMRVSSQGIAKGDGETVLSLLGLGWEPAGDGAGRVILTFAGDGAIAAAAECLDVTLRDVTQPYTAPSGKVPHHPE